MVSVLKKTYTKPLPSNAVVFIKAERQYARFRNRKGKVVVAPMTRTGRIRLTASKAYLKFKDGNGITRCVPGAKDKAVAYKLAADLERTGKPEHVKPLDPHQDAKRTPLAEHLADWERFLLTKDVTEDYAVRSVAKARIVLKRARVKLWGDLSALPIQEALHTLMTRPPSKKANIGPRTFNEYLRCVKQFAGWLVKDGRVPHNPLAHIEQRNARTDIRRRRRPLTPGECRLLLKATPLQPRREGLSGLERAWAYRIALETGLRLGEIKKLVKADFILSANPPTVTVRAAYSKHRREDIQPLPIRLAADLVAFLSGYPEDQPIFASFDHAPKALEADLKAVGIPYKDAAGRFADFHALRHTYISNLSLAGVPPKIAMDLARHSSIQLTMDFYSHTRLEECAAALKVLPELVAAAEQVTDETQDRNASSHVAKAEPLCPPAGTSDFDALTQAWPTLPEQVKAGIMALIQSTLQQQA